MFLAVVLFVAPAFGAANGQDAADLNDLEIGHVAYVADNIDIRYAHLALAMSTNPEIHDFAKTMICDHTLATEFALETTDGVELNYYCVYHKHMLGELLMG